MIGPNGERWLPVHTVVPHSKAVETVSAVNAVFAKNAESMEKHGIGTGLLLVTVSTNLFAHSGIRTGKIRAIVALLHT